MAKLQTTLGLDGAKEHCQLQIKQLCQHVIVTGHAFQVRQMRLTRSATLLLEHGKDGHFHMMERCPVNDRLLDGHVARRFSEMNICVYNLTHCTSRQCDAGRHHVSPGHWHRAYSYKHTRTHTHIHTYTHTHIHTYTHTHTLREQQHLTLSPSCRGQRGISIPIKLYIKQNIDSYSGAFLKTNRQDKRILFY